jgi:transposase InsO family protein
MTFYHPKLRDTVEAVLKPCDECQRIKNVQRGHGHTAPREARLLPWSDIAVDLIRPWKLTIGNRTVEFRALTIIDLVTNLVELVRINSKTSREVTHAFVNTWLARYPKPVSCIYDQGTEFIGYEFQNMLERNNIEKRQKTTKNPQSNAICERMHQSVGNSLRILRDWRPPLQGLIPAQQLVSKCQRGA